MTPLGLGLCLLTATSSLVAQDADPRTYEAPRHDENSTDWSDRLKYIPLSDTSEDRLLALGGEVRERIEWVRNADWDSENDPDAYALQRYMLFADLHLGRHFRLFTHLKSALENGRRDGPRPTDEDRLDLHELFANVRLKSMEVRLGRQELAFGSQRLVSTRRGPNVPRSFDGLDVVVRPGRWRVDVFATKPVETNPGTFDDGSEHDREFWGVYAVGPLRLPHSAHLDLYYLGLDRDEASFEQGTASELRETVGARFWGQTARWDYNVEVVYQWGRFGAGSIHAWTVASDTGRTLESTTWRPRMGLKADITSGDEDPNDSALQSFHPLFPRGSYFGENALIGPINHIDLHPSIDLHPTEALTISAGWVSFWRESRNDGLYDVPGNLVRPGAGTDARHVGSQPTLRVDWDISRHVTVVATLEYLLAGSFLRETGPADDVTFAASWLTFSF